RLPSPPQESHTGFYRLPLNLLGGQWATRTMERIPSKPRAKGKFPLRKKRHRRERLFSPVPFFVSVSPEIRLIKYKE
ncbi:MAG: hypothetical protein IJE17_12770, partial [Clostridia bacterium]|nr:hypothetical protein [Clostridia bacterium]